MHWQINLDALLLILCGGIVIVVAFGLRRQRSAPGAICLLSLMVASAIWCFSSALEHSTDSVSTQIFASKLQHIGIQSISPMFFLFSLAISKRTHWLTRNLKIGVWIVPLITILLAFTNEYHHLIWTEFIPTYGAEHLIYQHGSWFWISTAYDYILLLLGSILIAHIALRDPDFTGQQAFLIMLAIAIPIITNITYLTKVFPLPGIDPTPFAFSISGILFAFSIYRYRLFDITPIARDQIVDSLSDLVIVVNKELEIIDLNPIARKILDKKREHIIGTKAKNILTHWPYLVSQLGPQFGRSTMIPTIQDQDGLWYSLRITSLQDQQGEFTGWVILLRDITNRKAKEDEIKRLASIIETASESVVLTDTQGQILYVNSFFEQVTGYTRGEALGQNPRILKSDKQNAAFYKELWDTIKSGNAWQGTFINRRKDGNLYHEAATVFPIKNSQGEITNYAAVKRDITEKVKSDQAIQEFLEKLTVLNRISIQLSEAIAFDDLCQMVIEFGIKKLGFERIGMWLLDLDDSEFMLGSFGTDETGKIRDERSQKIPLSDLERKIMGSYKERIYQQKKHPLHNDKREIVGYGEYISAAMWNGQQAIGYIAADTFFSQQPFSESQKEIFLLYTQIVGNSISRKRAEDAIQESERQYRLLADNASDVIWTMDLQGHFTYISPSVEQMRSYTPEEALQQTLSETLTSESYQIASVAYENIIFAIHNGEKLDDNFTIELEQTCKDGSTVWTEVIINILFDDQDNALGLLGVTRNITERRQAQEEIREYARFQKLLNEITHVAMSQSDFDEMLQILADRVGELLYADGCYITLWEDVTQRVKPGAAYGPIRDTYRTKIKSPEPDEPTLTASVLRLGKPLAIPDVHHSPFISPRIAAQFPAESQLALPLIANDQKLGAALIAFNQKHEFTNSEIRIGEQAASQIALAILKARLLDEAESRATEAETLRQVSAAVVSTLKQDETIERILEELNRVVPYDSASVMLAQDTLMEIVGSRGFGDVTKLLGLQFAVTEETPNKVVFETRKPYILEDAPAEYPAFKKAPHDHIRGWMGIPLLIRDRLIGMLTLDSKIPGRFNQDHARVASAFADQVAIALENARLFEETRRLAITDPLTDLYNRRHFMELARHEFTRAKRYHIPLSIIMLDIDHFKNINDTYGHLTGDQVLQTTAFICRKNLRAIDIIGRYGGEEFVILLPQTAILDETQNKTDLNASKTRPAKIVAERLRETIAQTTFEIGENSITMTISLGVAEYTAVDSDIENVIDYADQALLQAKSQGRNRVVIWKSEENLA